MKIPLGSWKLYGKRNLPWESAKWDLQNKRCAKYALEKRANPSEHHWGLSISWGLQEHVLLHCAYYKIAEMKMATLCGSDGHANLLNF